MASSKSNSFKMLNKLSILIAQDGLCFCVSTDNRISSFITKEFSSPQTPEVLLSEIKTILTVKLQLQLGNHDFKRIHVLYAHSLYSLVPKKYFSQEHLSAYLKYNTKLLPTDQLAFDELTALSANLVYVPYTNINNYLVEFFGEFDFKHALTALIEDHCEYGVKHEQEIRIQVYPTHFDCLVYHHKKLLLANSFDYFAPSDFLYYLLFTIEQLQLDRERVQVYLSGVIAKESELFELLYTYIRHINLYTPKIKPKVEHETLKQLPSHYHELILNFDICE